MFKSFLEHAGDALGRDLLVVEDALELESLEGIGDIVDGAYGGEYLVEDATCLDVLVALTAILVVALNELLAAVALAELDLVAEGAHGDGQGLGGLEEGVGCSER